MTFLARQAFAKMFQSDPDDLDMHVIYDVSHNIAKVEEHFVDGKPKTLLVRLNCYIGPFIYYLITFLGFLDPPPPLRNHVFSTENNQKMAMTSWAKVEVD